MVEYTAWVTCDHKMSTHTVLCYKHRNPNANSNTNPNLDSNSNPTNPNHNSKMEKLTSL